MVEELAISIRYNGGWKSVMGPHMLEKEISYLWCCNSFGARDEDGHLGETTNHYENAIMVSLCHG